jgi:hypothetical protein
MEYRGPILLVFGLSLVISPLAIRLAAGETTASDLAEMVSSVELDRGCAGNELHLANRGSVCANQTAEAPRGRVMPGGAVFVSARN